jgi:hypothetical protein
MPNYRNSTSGSITTNGQSVSLAYREFFNGGVGIQVTGTWTGTLQFEMSINGTDFVAVSSTNVTTGSMVTTTTANAVFRFDAIGASVVRVTATAAMTGTANIALAAMPG